MERCPVADEIISLTTVKLNNMLVPVFEAAEAMAAELRVFLERHGFPPAYIEACVENVKDGWLNSDQLPLWHHPHYKPPQEDL